jgi:hypothetical protein
MLTILEDNPAIIIIDALDECELSSRHLLLDALKHNHPAVCKSGPDICIK